MVLGAAAGFVSGAILKNGSAVNNAINGAAAGAAVNPTNQGKKADLVRDAAVGAAASIAAGVVTRRGRDSLKNAIQGAADGALINLERRR